MPIYEGYTLLHAVLRLDLARSDRWHFGVVVNGYNPFGTLINDYGYALDVKGA